MSELYIAVHRTGDSNEELQHYGVKGMRWGVRRASKALSKATTREDKVKAVATLQKHREKASKEVAKLQQKQPKLERSVEKQIVKNDIKAAKLGDKAATKRKKAYGMFTSQKKAEKLIYKADKLQARADYLEVKSKKAKAKLARNETMQAAFKKGINEIDQTIASKGRRYING